MRARIAEHRARRGPQWETIEAPLDLAAALARSCRAPALVDCLTLWLTNLMLEEHDIEHAVAQLNAALDARQAPTVLVANEVGLGIVPDNALARRFRDEAGRLNQRLAARADRVLFMIAGIALKLKRQRYTESIAGGNKVVVDPNQENEEDLYEMANLYPRDTGLPMTIWVSQKGNARHDIRIKVCLTPGDRMDASNTAVVGVRPQPRVVAGNLPPQDFAAVAKWITLNAAALIGYWEGTLSTVEFAARIQKV